MIKVTPFQKRIFKRSEKAMSPILVTGITIALTSMFQLLVFKWQQSHFESQRESENFLTLPADIKRSFMNYSVSLFDLINYTNTKVRVAKTNKIDTVLFSTKDTIYYRLIHLVKAQDASVRINAIDFETRLNRIRSRKISDSYNSVYSTFDCRRDSMCSLSLIVRQYYDPLLFDDGVNSKYVVDQIDQINSNLSHKNLCFQIQIKALDSLFLSEGN
ncbi:MAG: hypothetical protein AB7O48_14885 [Cyclobacteriaceae bacterium]